nr:MAG TPA: hypothetical protein [Caudoviricetes sp.]
MKYHKKSSRINLGGLPGARRVYRINYHLQIYIYHMKEKKSSIFDKTILLDMIIP